MKKQLYILKNKTMPMRKRISFALWPMILAIVCFMSFDTALGQVTVFSENFEHGGSFSSEWVQEYSSPEWQIRQNGIGSSSYPSSAHSGTYCAGMYYGNTYCDYNYLITPTIDLSQYASATLTFYLYKKDRGSDSDELTVYYRTSSSGTWIQLDSYSWDIGSWQLQTVNLPNLSANYQIRFGANCCYGYGVYIDDVVVTGRTCDETIILNQNINRTIECGRTYCFYDSGGANGQYENSQSYTAVFTSSDAITMTFNAFYTESGYDELTVYDGLSSSGVVLLYQYSGEDAPPPLTATSGTMTVVWYSDGSQLRDGWIAIINGCQEIITGSPDCESAMAFCATNDAAGYDMLVHENDPEVDNLDFMCDYFVNPSWWYLRVSQSGPIEMTISSCGDVDFGCWGPFSNPTCSPNDLSDQGASGYQYCTGAELSSSVSTQTTAAQYSRYSTTTSAICGTFNLAAPCGNLVDFGGSSSAVEYLRIPDAHEGTFYMLLVANYENCAGNISMLQTNINDPNAGRSDCTIVNDCEITSVTVDEISNCAGNGTYSVSGNIHFNNVPADGTLTVSAAGVSQVFRPPFSSPQSYSLSGLPGNGEHDVTITAEFASSTINCDKINYFDAPMCQIDCPDATVAMTGYDEYTDGRYYYDVCLRSGVNMVGTQTGYTNPSWVWSINPHGGQRPYVINGQNASYTPAAEQGYDISLTVSEGECSTVAYGRIRVSGGLETSVSDYALGEICVGDSREVTIGGSGSDIQVNPTPHTIETSLGHAETTFIPDGLNCETQCYESSVTFYDFDDGALVTNTDAIKYIKLNTEHSFIGDVQIKITCPERNGVRRSAVILQDYYSNDPNSNAYSANAIDTYTYNWPYMTTTTVYLVGSNSSYYTGIYLGGSTASTPEGRTYTSEGNTFYFITFPTSADAYDFMHNYLEVFFSGLTYEVNSINSGSYYAISYTVVDDNGSTRYYVYMTNDVTTNTRYAYTFQNEAAAQYYLNTVLGESGVVTRYTNTDYSLVYFGEPDVYDRADAQNMTSAEICDGTNPHNTHGIGYDYAWTSNSQYTTVGHVYDVANVTSPSTVYSGGTIYDSQTFTSLYHVLPSNVDAGTQMYQPFESFSSLIGCPLNGTWTISVCDSWEKDNGYVFDWEIALSEDLLPSNWDYTVDLDEVTTQCGDIATVSNNNLTIAPQTPSNGQESCYINLYDNLGCSTNIPLTYTAVEPTIAQTTDSGDEDQTVCEGQAIVPITYTLGGVAVNATISWTPSVPAGLTFNVSGNTVTLSGAPTAHNTYNYTITTVSRDGLTCTEKTATGRIIVNVGNVIPTFTQVDPYCEGSTVNALPTTSNNDITGHWEPEITNSTNTYTFIPDGGQCAVQTQMTVTVNLTPTLGYTSGSETLCKGETNANIVFTYGGGANGASIPVSGAGALPAGMRFDTDATNHQIIISGVPTVGAGEYQYTVTTTGATSPCTNVPVTRTITVVEPATLVLTDGDETQSVCNGGVVNFVYTYGGSAGGAEVVGDLPEGLSSTLDAENHTLTISGHPSAEGSFTVSTTNVTAPCGNATLTGAIEITDPADLDLLSESPDVVLCVEVPWEGNIQYQFGGAATGVDLDALNNDLPDGMTATVEGNIVTISGSPTLGVEAGEYPYTVTTTGVAPPCQNIPLGGTITVSTNAEINLTSAPPTIGIDTWGVCLPGTFSNIVYTYSGGATGINEDLLRDALPAGLDFTVNHAAHTVTIHGTPTETGRFNYTVETTGVIPPCKPDDASGTLVISQSVELESTPNASQNFCLGNDLDDIVFTYGGGATGVQIVDGDLPAGVEPVYDTENHTLTLTGTPTEQGIYTFNVTTTGAVEPCTDIFLPVSITVYESPQVEINASADAICNGASVSLASSPASFNSYSWTCTTVSDATHTINSGMPSSSTTSSINVSPTVTPGSADVVYVLRVSNSSNCAATASHTVNVSSTVTAEIAKTDNTMCEEPYNSSITISNFAGGTAGSTYTVTATGLTTQTTTGDAVTFSNVEAGSYTIRITNETTSDNCSFEQVVRIDDNHTSPTVSISGSLSICEGTNTTLTAHGANGLEPYTYSWSNSTSGPELVTPNLTAPTPYTVSLTDANGCLVTNTVTVEIGDTPSIEVTADNACLNDEVVLQAQVSNAGTGYTVTWTASPSAAAAGLLTTTGERISVTPTAADSYTYTATLHANSCSTSAEFTDDDNVVVIVHELPEPTITPPTAEVSCNNNHEVSATVSAANAVSYMWSNSVTTADNTFNASGPYQVTVTDNNGCTGTAEIVITSDEEEPNVEIILNPDITELDCNNSSIKIIAYTDTEDAYLERDGVSLSPSGTVDNPYLEMITADMIDSETGIYVFEVTAVAPNGCRHTETRVITRNANTPTVTINTPVTSTLDCVTQSINLSATGTGTFTWEPSNVATHDNYPTDGNYIVTASYDNGCSAMASIHIDRSVDVPVPHISPSTDEELTLNCTVQSLNLVASVESGEATYAWYQGPHEATYTIHGSGDYTVTATAANGCWATASVHVSQDGDVPDVTVQDPPMIVCDPDYIELVVSSETPGIQFTWEDGVNPAHITEPGVYHVTATAPNGCYTARTITVSSDNENPNLTITPPASTVLNCNNSTNHDDNYDIPIELVAPSTTDGTMLSWTEGTSTAGSATLNVLNPGHYTVTATAPNGCISTATIEITEDSDRPNVVIGNNSNTTVLTCAGPSISVTLIDDSDADDYVWSGGENLIGTGNSFTSAGTYYVTATAPNGCISVEEITITSDLYTPTVNIINNTVPEVTELSCEISTIYVTAEGSQRVVSYGWSGGTYTDQAPNAFTTIGVYVVTVTADNGCTGTTSIEITETMGRPHVDVEPQTAVLTCSTPQVDISATGNAVSYAWSGGLHPDEATNTVETPGIYTVTATAENGCTAVRSVNITQNVAPPTVEIINESGFNQIDCNSTTVEVYASGTGDSYQWSDGDGVLNTPQNSFTSAGTYTVTAIGSNGCQAMRSVVITEDFTPPTPNITFANSLSSIDCVHDEVTLNATGGVSYSWSNGQNGQSITVNEPGPYTVTAIGQNGCPGQYTITVTANNDLPEVYIENMSSIGTLSCNNPQIEIRAQVHIQGGGVPTFAWGNQLYGGGSAQVVTQPGIYTVTVTAPNGCMSSAQIEIRDDFEPPALNIIDNSGSYNSETESYELDCNTDVVRLAASGNAITYQWSGGSNPNNPVNTFDQAGTYTVTATGSNGCATTSVISVTSNHAVPQIQITSENGTEITCDINQIHVIVTGQNVENYRWNDGYTTGDRMIYARGLYSVTVTGSNGCVAKDSIVITENRVPPVVSIVNNTGTSELNCSTTEISFTAFGGQSYIWDDGSVNPTHIATTQGQYRVTAVAENGCRADTSVIVTQAPEFIPEVSSIGTIACHGGTTSATVVANGGNPPYNYHWSNGEINPTAIGLAAGTYTVTVGDYGGCSAVLQCTVREPMELDLQIVSHDLICGVSQGSLNAVAIGGTQPYTYVWANGTMESECANLNVGQYGVTVIDANECMANAVAQVTMQGMLSVNTHVNQQISCHGYNDGIVSAECPNAAEPLFYSWSTGNASAEIYNLFEGTYTVTVTDAWGCSGQAGVNLVAPPEMNIQTYIEAPKCHNTQDGKIVATAFGGVAPYTYQWNTSVAENELVDVGMGIYTLTISDAAGCSVVKSVALDAPDAIVVETIVNEIKCNGDKTGRMEIVATGGVEPYTYSIDGLIRPSGVNVFTNMNSGYYTVRVIDNNGCEEVKPTLLSQPDALHVEARFDDPFCRNSRTGRIELVATGGTEPYIYYWNNSKSDVSVMQNIPAGRYEVGVIDGNNCKSNEQTVTLIDVDISCLRIPNVFTPNADGVNDTWTIDNIDMFPTAEVYIFNRWGQLLFTSKGYPEEWDGRYRGHLVPAGTYLYIIDLFDDDEPYKGTVTVIY